MQPLFLELRKKPNKGFGKGQGMGSYSPPGGKRKHVSGKRMTSHLKRQLVITYFNLRL